MSLESDQLELGFSIVCLSCYNLIKTNKEPTTLNDNSGKRVLQNFQCTFSAALYCICDRYLIITCGHDDCLIAFNQMQQTICMRLNSIPYDRPVICITYFQVYYYLMQYYLNTMGCQMRFVDCNFL